MFDVNNKQYLLGLSTGRKAYLHCSQEDGILMKWQLPDGSWEEPIPLADNCLGGFSAIADRHDVIHLIYQDFDGNLIYMHNPEDKWNQKTIYKSKNQDIKKKHLQIAYAGNILFVIYVIEYGGEHYLTFLELTRPDGQITSRTIDKLCNIPSYTVLHNKRELFIFYKALKNEKRMTGFRKYEIGDRKWSSFLPLPSPLSDLDVICSSRGSSGTIHLCLQRTDGKKHLLIYSKAAGSTNNWDSVTLAESDETFLNTGIISESNCIRIYWVNRTGIYHRISYDKGDSWEKEQRLDSFDIGNTCCLSYIKNNYEKLRDEQTSIVPAAFGKTLRFAFTDSACEKYQEKTGSENQISALNETLNILTKEIDTINNSIAELYKKLTILETCHKQLELEVKANEEWNDILEKKAEEINIGIDAAMNERFDLLKTEIKNIQTVIDEIRNEKEVKSDNVPLMPGTGFNSITAGFLKNIKNK